MVTEEYDPYPGIPINYSTPPIPSLEEEARSTSLIKELSPSDYLKDMMHELKGELWDKAKQEYVLIDGAKPIMNQEGMDIFFHFATSVLSPIVTFSNYRADIKRIHAIVSMQIKKASIHFHLHYKDYGITRKTKINIITDKLMILALSAFYKALGAGDRKAATSRVSESISTQNRMEAENNPTKRGGIISRMLHR